MAAPKGNSYSPGRPKGSKNQITQDTREAYKMFVQGNLGRLNEWMDELDSPEKKLDFMLKFSEYFIPKLARTDIDISSKGESLNFKHMSDAELVKFVAAKE